ncbi:MAG: carboxypeptidase-like regulatory domain-containing protein [Bacteroidales bacterium]
MNSVQKILLLAITAFVLASCSKTNETFVVSGQVTDFNGQPIDSATVRLMDRSFKELYKTLSDSNGNYSMTVQKGDYYCLYAIKLSEYRVNRLEYWAWNVPVYQNMIINPQYDRIEIYGINVFEPQVTPQETYMVYFRPMSLLKTQQVVSEKQVNSQEFVKAKQTESLFGKNDKWLNIAPDSITANELTVEINGAKAKILGISKVTEYARGIFMYGYNVQVLKPAMDSTLQLKYNKISVTLHSAETDEMGKAEAFVAR